MAYATVAFGAGSLLAGMGIGCMPDNNRYVIPTPTVQTIYPTETPTLQDYTPDPKPTPEPAEPTPEPFDITDFNNYPIGEVLVEGVFKVGKTLKADASSIRDFDGLMEFSYQWQHLFAGDWIDIEGATSDSYKVMVSDSKRRLRVSVSYTDGLGVHEEVVSDSSILVLDEYARFFNSNQRPKEEFSSYFTREFFDDVGLERYGALASFVNNASSGTLSAHNKVRLDEIRDFLDGSNSLDWVLNFNKEDFVEYLNTELNQQVEEYGYSDEIMKEFLDYAVENREILNSINSRDVNLLGEIFVSSPTIINYYNHEVSRIINSLREGDIQLLSDSRSISDYLNSIAIGSKRNNKDDLPIFPVSVALFLYNFEGNYIGSNTSPYTFDSNIKNHQRILDYVWEYLEDPKKKIFEFGDKSIIEFLGPIFLSNEDPPQWVTKRRMEIAYTSWSESRIQGKIDWESLREKDSSINQIADLMALALVQKAEHLDLFTYRLQVLGSFAGMNTVATVAWYPYGSRSQMAATRLFSIPITEKRREILNRVSDEELVNDQWLSIPLTRKNLLINDQSPSIALRTIPFYTEIYRFDGNVDERLPRNKWRSVRDEIHSYIDSQKEQSNQ